MKAIYKIVVINSNYDAFDYSGEEINAAIGARVWVPFRKQIRVGVVIAKIFVDDFKQNLKNVISIIDEKPLLNESILTLCKWVSYYYKAPLSAIFFLALPKNHRLGKIIQSPITTYYQKHGLPKDTAKSLNKNQEYAVNYIKDNSNTHRCFLLHGVTGSGKTEVYLQVIAQVLQKGLQVLLIVPEIGLTPQLLARLNARFNEKAVVIHSKLSDGERAKAWQMAACNLVKLVIGTRTAIFTPMPALALIVVDEEHDSSLKQMMGVRYSARDTAVMRAKMINIPIILGSATPSLESLYNCMQAKYTLLPLSQKAMSIAPLHYQLIDMRSNIAEQGIADKTLTIIRTHLQQNNQVLVFINRRGFAPILICHSCNWMADCPDCDSHLTVHQNLGKLICHHCGYSMPTLLHCGRCQQKVLLPIGIGTQRVYNYLAQQFPDVCCLRIDRDEVVKKNALEDNLLRINSGEAQLIIGTQMLAKGHHFPRITLVVVLDADAGFYNHDFRAIEKLGQVLTQVSGRAGRETYPGNVVIQTYLPHHPMLNLLIKQGYGVFAKELLTTRHDTKLPPYHYLALIRAQDKEASKTLNFLLAVKEQLLFDEITVLGPAPAPLARKAGSYHMQLLLKSSTRMNIQYALDKLKLWLIANKLNNKLRWSMDIDPVDLS